METCSSYSVMKLSWLPLIMKMGIWMLKLELWKFGLKLSELASTEIPPKLEPNTCFCKMSTHLRRQCSEGLFSWKRSLYLEKWNTLPR